MSPNAQDSIFRGDSPELVDHLIFACNERKMKKPVDGIFGRELKPYFKAMLPPPNRGGKAASCGSPPRSCKQCSPVEPFPRGQRAARIFCDIAPRAPATRVVTVHSSTGGHTSPVSTRGRSNATEAACPRFFSCPKPAEIPLPSKAFMAKAIQDLTKASANDMSVAPKICFSSLIPISVSAA